MDRRKALDNIEELIRYSKKPLPQPLLPLPQALVRQALNMNETIMQLTTGKADRRLNFDGLARNLTAVVPFPFWLFFFFQSLLSFSDLF